MPKMIALKSHRYGNRNVRVNELVDVSVHHVQLVRAMGWAAMYNVKAMTAENTPSLVPTRVVETVAVQSPSEPELSQVEVEQPTDYRQMLISRANSMGIHVDGRWSSLRIQQEIDRHNSNTYQRRDMAAEE